MRLLIGLLLLANAGMFAWVMMQPSPQPDSYRPVPVPPGIEPLILLSERTPRTPAPAPEEPPVKAPDGPPKSGAASPATADGVAPEVADPVGASVQQSSDQGAVAADRPRLCQSVGPFRTPGDAETFAAQLTPPDFQTQVRTEATKELSDYWIYLPEMSSAEARRIVEELKAQGMTDYYVGKRNTISLGIFKGERQAQARLEQVRGLGFEAVLGPRFRTRTLYWIDVVSSGEALAATGFWRRSRSQFPGIELQDVACE